MEEVLNEDNRRIGNDLKIILIGNLSTGKTSIINRYINNNFEEHCRATIAPEFSYKVVKSNGIIFRLQFWDLPGQERNPIVTGLFCKGSNAVICCCEVNNNKSREDISKWEETLKHNIDIDNIPKILLENKCDLLGDEDKYNENIEELKKFSDEHNFSACYRTSALNGYNIDNAIKFLVDEIVQTLSEEDINIIKEGNSNMIDLNKSQSQSTYVNESQKCC